MYDPYSVGENEREAYDQAGSRNLIPPKSAARTTKVVKGVLQTTTRWTELVQITDIQFKEPGFKEPDEPGDKTFSLNVHFKVMNDSEQDGLPSPNRGRGFVEFLSFNIPAFRRAAGESPKGQAWITARGFALLKSLLKSLNMDEDLGRTPRAFAEEAKGEFIGTKAFASIELFKKDETSDERQQIVKFISDTP